MLIIGTAWAGVTSFPMKRLPNASAIMPATGRPMKPCPTLRRLDARQSLAALDWQSGVVTPDTPAPA
jgi:hypothetical protein